MPAKSSKGRGAAKAPGAGSSVRGVPHRKAAPAAGRSAGQGARKAIAPLDQRLAGIARLEDRIAELTHAIPGRIAFSTSLGLEDQAILHAIAASGAALDVFTLDTGRHFPETLETLEASERRYRLRIRVVAPDAREVEELVARDGIFGFRLAVENRKSCCEIRKVRPLKRALEGAAGWVTGLRRDQSAERATVPFAVWDAEHSLVKVNPIADWTLDRLEAYIAENDVPVNPLHAKGFPSIGCQPCTRAIKPGEDIRAGRWWWENEDGKECGLHNRPGHKEAAA
jgi:phosphoadenosine phosphosulfate reductase